MTNEQQTKTAARADLFKRLEELEIPTTTVDHDPVHTVAESSTIDRDLPGGHTKNLFLKDAKGQLFLVIARTTTQIDLKKLHRRIDAARLSFGNAQLMQETLGVTPGSVTAFAVINDREHRVKVIFDKELMREESINCHPLENSATTNIARDDLLRFMRTCGHEPLVIKLSDQ